MKTLRDTHLLFVRYSVQMLRNPVWLVVGISTPLLYLALFTPLLKGLPSAPGLGSGSSVLDLFLPGILALLAFGSGVGSGFSTIFEMQSGVTERFRVTPASRLAILLGPIVSGIVAMLIFDAILVIVGALFGFAVHLLGLLVLGVLLSVFMAMMAAFSTAIALLTKEISAFAAIVNGINLPVLLLAGVLLPISLGPTWMEVLAHFDPLYYLVIAARPLASGDFSASNVWLGFAVLVPLCALTLAWATTVLRRLVA